MHALFFIAFTPWSPLVDDVLIFNLPAKKNVWIRLRAMPHHLVGKLLPRLLSQLLIFRLKPQAFIFLSQLRVIRLSFVFLIVLVDHIAACRANRSADQRPFPTATKKSPAKRTYRSTASGALLSVAHGATTDHKCQHCDNGHYQES
jgi:hypothetical protein